MACPERSRGGILEMAGPGDAGQPPHEQGDGEAIGPVPGEPDRQEAEDERPRCAPEPDVLVEHVEDHDREREQESIQLNVLQGAILPMLKRLIIFAVLVTAFITPAAAQTAANISGLVVDQTGVPLPGVSVTAKNGATGLTRTVTTGP